MLQKADSLFNFLRNPLVDAEYDDPDYFPPYTPALIKKSLYYFDPKQQKASTTVGFRNRLRSQLVAPLEHSTPSTTRKYIPSIQD
jgi:hypothetical protein